MAHDPAVVARMVLNNHRVMGIDRTGAAIGGDANIICRCGKKPYSYTQHVVSELSRHGVFRQSTVLAESTALLRAYARLEECGLGASEAGMILLDMIDDLLGQATAA